MDKQAETDVICVQQPLHPQRTRRADAVMHIQRLCNMGNHNPDEVTLHAGSLPQTTSRPTHASSSKAAMEQQSNRPHRAPKKEKAKHEQGKNPKVS
jgi:hypothetical protein